ncbi:hypothetical protein VCRA2120O333_90054 [Vibrio crassostreae]|nr:hypothetical protein VCRA2113O322_10396 [Vibrio crassostreae]CDU00916.1 hypothetical protein VCR12J2_620407 [Vibrio coralliirubri]CAK1882826.1 hypothetical protein VCRA2113O324_10392 [Vibrio crassostreae]CAK1886924.1 hypothetical protein VCRA2113O326_10395 [Vibrio crassostreae]CAK2677958.1 hypothetical protein VCRA2113O323_10516 [Vibrio crassostreae]
MLLTSLDYRNLLASKVADNKYYRQKSAVIVLSKNQICRN